jgi:uncharacterized protein (DUF1015 family)
LTAEDRQRYAAQSEFNVVHLTLPEGSADDRSKFVKYARSAATLGGWRRAVILAADDGASLYRLRQSYRDPISGDTHIRTSIVALVRADDEVVPTERTSPSEREDRLRIFEATRAQYESATGLYDDADGAVADLLAGVPVGASVVAEGAVLEPISDPEAVAGIQAAMVGKTVWVVEGFDRFDGVVEAKSEWVLMTLTASDDPGLVVLPVYRVARRLRLTLQEIVDRLAPWFECHLTHSRNLRALLQQEAGIGIATEGGEAGFFTLREPNGGSGLDVLNRLVLQEALPEAKRGGFDYFEGFSDAIFAVDSGAGVAFCVGAPTMVELLTAAPAGESGRTHRAQLFPKVPSGLVMWSLND